MFDDQTRRAIERIAKQYDWPAAALLAVAEVESAGKAFALVNGRKEPLIRFEGHYFDKRLTAAQRKVAREQGLASPVAGAVKNPATQAARWRILDRATMINAQAAFESVSWGVGQVMGVHWKALGFSSVTDLVNLCRRDVAGQVELMARFIDKNGLSNALRNRDWAAFARGYNGPDYKRGGYNTKIAAAYARYGGEVAPSSTTRLQERLTAHGFPVAVDGVSGPKTVAAVRAFQKAKGLSVDGIAGPATWAALDKEPSSKPAPVPAPSQPKPQTSAPSALQIIIEGLRAFLSRFAKGA